MKNGKSNQNKFQRVTQKLYRSRKSKWEWVLSLSGKCANEELSQVGVAPQGLVFSVIERLQVEFLIWVELSILEICSTESLDRLGLQLEKYFDPIVERSFDQNVEGVRHAKGDHNVSNVVCELQSQKH